MTLPNGSAELIGGCKENCPGETSETASLDGLHVAQQTKQSLRLIWAFIAYCSLLHPTVQSHFVI